MTKKTILKYLANRIDQVICSHDALNIFVFTDDGEQTLIALQKRDGEMDEEFIERGFEKVEKEFPIDETV